jgi:hypothetical protein
MVYAIVSPTNANKATQRPQGLLAYIFEREIGIRKVDENMNTNKTAEGSFPLSKLFGAGEGFIAVYFRTEDGDIYRLGRDGVLTSANASREAGLRIEMKLPTKALDKEDAYLKVGERFDFVDYALRYSEFERTTAITEIYAVARYTARGEIENEFDRRMPSDK